MLKFACPSCSTPLKGPEALAGKTVRCPGCQHLVTVPGTGPAPYEPAHSPILVPPASAFPGPAAPPAAERPARPAPPPHAPEPAASLQPPDEPRAAYFAPAGYAASDPRTVPFKAPGFRCRLGCPAATRAATDPPPASAPDPTREPAPADREPEARP